MFRIGKYSIFSQCFQAFVVKKDLKLAPFGTDHGFCNFSFFVTPAPFCFPSLFPTYIDEKNALPGYRPYTPTGRRENPPVYDDIAPVGVLEASARSRKQIYEKSRKQGIVGVIFFVTRFITFNSMTPATLIPPCIDTF